VAHGRHRPDPYRAAWRSALGGSGAWCSEPSSPSVSRVATNLAITMYPINAGTITQDAGFVSVQNSLSISCLANAVRRGSRLSSLDSAGTIFATDNCSGLFLSIGNEMKFQAKRSITTPGNGSSNRLRSPTTSNHLQPAAERPHRSGPLPLMTWEDPRPGARRLGRVAPATRRFGNLHQLSRNDHMFVCSR
jgi:hypothetical protein